MINYPNGKKKMNFENKAPIEYANRGLLFEEEINRSNEYYRLQNIAVIYKKPTPIKVVKMQQGSLGTHCITEAYFQAPSTTDYNGIYKGKYIDFEAKETRNKTSFPLANIHPHQIQHMQQVIEHGGIGFLLVYFKMLNQVFLLDYRHVIMIHQSQKSSIPYSLFCEQGKAIPQGYVIPFDYLKIIDQVYFK